MGITAMQQSYTLLLSAVFLVLSLFFNIEQQAVLSNFSNQTVAQFFQVLGYFFAWVYSYAHNYEPGKTLTWCLFWISLSGAFVLN